MANPQLWAAVGDAGRIETSPDGVTWTVRTSGTSRDLEHIAWSPDLEQFLAVGTNATALTSPDGDTWTARTTGQSSTRSLRGAAWSPELSLWVVVGDSGFIATSSDGLAWTTRTAPYAHMMAVAWSPDLGLFVAVGLGVNEFATSPDGATWTDAGVTSSNGFTRALEWSPDLGLFVAVTSTGAVLTSADGPTWTFRSTTLYLDGDLYDVAWSPALSRWVTVGELNRSGTSSDGTAWSEYASGVSDLFGIGWSADLGQWVRVGTNHLATSSTGLSGSWSGRRNVTFNAVVWSDPVPNESPNTPTPVTPINNAATATSTITRFEWTYTDPDDAPTGTDAQSGYDLRYRIGDGAWTTINETSADHYYDMPADTFVGGNTYGWQVRTYDQSGAVSEWSTEEFFYADQAPVAAVVAPVGGAPVFTSGHGTFSWTYSDPEATPQTDYQIRYRIVGEATWTEMASVASAATSTTIAGSTFTAPNWYEWQVRAQDTDGSWSEWSTPGHFSATTTGLVKDDTTAYRVGDIDEGTFDPATDMQDNSNLI